MPRSLFFMGFVSLVVFAASPMRQAVPISAAVAWVAGG